MIFNSLNLMELGLMDKIQEVLGCGFLDFLMPVVSYFGDYGIFWIAVAVILLCFPKTRKLGLTLGISYLLGFVLVNGAVKNLACRIRPYDMETAKITAEQLLVRKLKDYSFPSGHTLICAEAASVLMIRARKPWGWISVGIMIAVMFSRVYLYVHYPSDVLFGAIFGIVFGIVACRLGDPLYDLAEGVIKKIRAKKVQ